MALTLGKSTGAAILMSRTCAIFLLGAMCLLVNAGGSGAETVQPGNLQKGITQRDAVGLNPQPEPPSRSKMKRKLRPVDLRGLNPQPEPPKPPIRY